MGKLGGSTIGGCALLVLNRSTMKTYLLCECIHNIQYSMIIVFLIDIHNTGLDPDDYSPFQI